MDMSVAIFVGPTLGNSTDLLCNSAIKQFPPAKKGDIFAIAAQNFDTIILVDGYFQFTPSVWTRELLYVLNQGIKVIGCSSMGALRAVELAPFGMIGYGQIFQWYSEGIIDSDAEVALIHESVKPYYPLSVPLVNIRYFCSQALGNELLTSDESLVLAELARSIYYQDRSIDQLISGLVGCGFDKSRAANICTLLAHDTYDLKKLDLISLLSDPESPLFQPELENSTAIPPHSSLCDHYAYLDSINVFAGSKSSIFLNDLYLQRRISYGSSFITLSDLSTSLESDKLSMSAFSASISFCLVYLASCLTDALLIQPEYSRSYKAFFMSTHPVRDISAFCYQNSLTFSELSGYLLSMTRVNACFENYVNLPALYSLITSIKVNRPDLIHELPSPSVPWLWSKDLGAESQLIVSLFESLLVSELIYHFVLSLPSVPQFSTHLPFDQSFIVNNFDLYLSSFKAFAEFGPLSIGLKNYDPTCESLRYMQFHGWFCHDL